jgi:hypothetical protein
VPGCEDESLKVVLSGFTMGSCLEEDEIQGLKICSPEPISVLDHATAKKFTVHSSLEDSDENVIKIGKRFKVMKLGSMDGHCIITALRGCYEVEEQALLHRQRVVASRTGTVTFRELPSGQPVTMPLAGLEAAGYTMEARGLCFSKGDAGSSRFQLLPGPEGSRIIEHGQRHRVVLKPVTGVRAEDAKVEYAVCGLPGSMSLAELTEVGYSMSAGFELDVPESDDLDRFPSALPRSAKYIYSGEFVLATDIVLTEDGAVLEATEENAGRVQPQYKRQHEIPLHPEDNIILDARMTFAGNCTKRVPDSVRLSSLKEDFSFSKLMGLEDQTISNLRHLGCSSDEEESGDDEVLGKRQHEEALCTQDREVSPIAQEEDDEETVLGKRQREEAEPSKRQDREVSPISQESDSDEEGEECFLGYFN